MNHDIKVKDEPGLVRQGENPAVISNVDVEGYHAYMAKRRAATETKERLEALEGRMNGIENALGQILNLLKGAKDG